MKHASRVWKSYWLGLLLAGLYPPLFLMSHNWFMYKPVQMLALLLVTVLGVFIGGAIARAAITGLLRVVGHFQALHFLTERRDRIQQGLEGAFISTWVIALLSNSIFAEFPIVVYLALGTMFIVGAMIFLLTCVAGRQVLNIMLTALVTMASVGLISSLMSAASLDHFSWYEKTRQEFADLQFSRKPNVYAIVMEAYQSSEAMREIYGIDNSDFMAELERRGFHVQDAFSNYCNTITSVGSMMTMSHHYYIPAMGNDDAVGLRDVIGGRVYNPVLDTFHHNGYRTQYICDDDYTYRRGSMLDYVYPAARISEAIELYQIDRLNELVHVTRAVLQGSRERKVPTFWSVAQERIAIAAASEEPYFSLIKPPATDHTPTKMDWTQLE